MPISRADQSIVANLRREYGDKIKDYSDELIAEAWKQFSQSNEYPDTNQERFPDWCVMVEANP